jgi:class 3 adenylate cyclase/tetratricopeptide (TPR) repeat protein
MRCASCGADNPDGMKFCGNCAAPLHNRCPRCGFENPPGFKFCGECAAPLSHSSAAPAAEQHRDPAGESRADLSQLAPSDKSSATGEVPEGERKTVTSLFADIKGSMDLMEDLDPEEARAVVDPALQIMIDAVHRYDGYIVQSTGDGVFALFGAPVAHEDHPQRAIYAALRMRDEMRRYGAELRERGNPPVEIRIGLNAGEVVVRTLKTGDAHAEYTPIGHATGLAARMQTLAPTGSIVVTDALHNLVQGYFEMRGLGPARIKGVSEPVGVYEVVGLGALRTRLQRSASRGLTKFVGRRAEIEQLKRALRLARGGHGQLVAAVADAGVGKSRLFHEFKALADPDCRILETTSVSHGKATACLPVIELLKGYFSIADRDDERTRLEKITGRVLALDRVLEDVLPHLFAMLGVSEGDAALDGMDPAIRRRRTREALKHLLLRESLVQPLIVVFEDLHWIDDETQAVLNLLVESLGTARLLLLVNYRPEYRHEWGNKSYYTQLRLDPLGRETAGELLGGLLGGDAALKPLRERIIARTEGNPFFMEEMVQVLFDQGVLTRNGVVKIARPFDSIEIPPTVKGILAARIDRLAAADKDLLQTLAVIGKEFALSLVTEVVPRDVRGLDRELENLQLAEFIYEQPASGDVEYTFKHALTQEVAYDSVLIERRRQVHARTAAALERVFADHLDDHYGELAHHYARSADTARAVAYLKLAASQAGQRSAYDDALRSIDDALRLLKTMPPSAERDRDELELLVISGPLLATAKGNTAPELAALLTRASDLSRRVGHGPTTFKVLIGLWAFNHLQGRLRSALEVLGQLMPMAEEFGADLPRAAANASMGSTLLWMGRITEARGYLESACAIFDRDLDTYLPSMQAPVVPSHCQLASALWILGYPDQGLRHAEKALELARRLGRPFSIAFALQHLTAIHALRREYQPMRPLCESLIELAREHGFPSWLASGEMSLAILEVAEGSGVDAVERAGRAVERLKSTGAGLVYNHAAMLLADAHKRLGRRADGLAVVEPAIEAIAEAEQRMTEPELYRLRGELLLLAPADEAAAEKSLARALELARAQGARAWELRAATSIARILVRRGDRAGARAALEPVYAWFTEGFATADLIDAKALLDELGAR